ncbi:hypothetical protein ACWDE0_28805 [Streptomyces sp. 900105755]|uniref:hypothetical protein n=1 Tax=Streptomyces sp. Ag109_O5-10 TaxID=1855349 RepID=UPI0008996D4B|nr:hypothetical protein [Streptomyces sp. Ag109_O5-10]SEE73576.1 hypothetical protein SAMN05216533_3464 [Streptomyces sp. Ag109_O5-10]
MDLQSTVTAFPRATPIDGLDCAWTWRLNPVLNFAGALTADGTRLLQMNQVRRHDEALAGAVLAFARAHEAELIVEGRFLTCVGGFEALGYSFDAVAATVPAVHGHHRVRIPDLMPLTTIVFPAYRCEFSGRETLEEAEARYHKMLPTADIGRGPVPFLKMRYDNPRTGGGSNNPGRALAGPEVLPAEIAELRNAPGGFVEYENHAGDVRRVEWDPTGTWVLSDACGRQELGLDELLPTVAETLRRSRS